MAEPSLPGKIMTQIQTDKCKRKTVATKVAMGTSFFLALAKVSAGLATGSLAVISSAVDSILDIVASFVNFVAIKKADEPADRGHEFGHGKYEALAAYTQALVIFATGAVILYSAYDKFVSKSYSETGMVGIYVMMGSIIVTAFLTFYLKYKAKKENSTVLETDSMHYAVDLYTGAGILLSLILIKITGYHFIDPLVAAIISVYIILSATRLAYKASKILLDTSLSEDAHGKLREVIDTFGEYSKSFHGIRTRTDGNKQFIEMHVTLCKDLKLTEASSLMEEIEKAIQERLPDADITIKTESCSHKEGEKHKDDCNYTLVCKALDRLK